VAGATRRSKTTATRLGKGTLRVSYAGGKRTGIFAHRGIYPRRVAQTRRLLHSGGWWSWLFPKGRW
jgi:hypothetical protein